MAVATLSVASLALSPKAWAAASTISTIAGGGGFGDSLAATSAYLWPHGIAVDPSGRIFITDSAAVRVRRFTVGGVITSVAGNGIDGFSGDGWRATSASLSEPNDVAIGSDGRLFIVDEKTRRVRVVDSTGTIATLAGDGGYGDWGDGGPATAAAFRDPTSVAVSPAGDVFIADAVNNTIRRVSPVGIITRFAGGGPGPLGDGLPATMATLSGPQGLAFDAAGNLFIADTSNMRVRRVDALTGVIATVAGNGFCCLPDTSSLATASSVSYPSDVAVDGAGSLFIAERGARVRRVDTAGTISTFAGTGTAGFSGDGGPAVAAQLNYPTHISLTPSGSVLIADLGNRRVRAVSPSGVISTIAGGAAMSVGDGMAGSLAMVDAKGVASDGAGGVFIADGANNRVRRVSSSGVITTVAGTGQRGYGGDGGSANSALLAYPTGVAIGPGGVFYVADYGNNRVRRVSSSGVITTVAGSGTAGYGGDGGPAVNAALQGPSRLTVDGIGQLFIADRDNNRIRKVTVTGVISTVAGDGTWAYGGDGGPAVTAHLAHPFDVAVDSRGTIYIADTDNHRIRRVSTSGQITTYAGTGAQGPADDRGRATAARVSLPYGIALSGDGSLYIAATEDYRVRRVTPDGMMSTIAGNGTYTFSGNGGPALAAGIVPYAVAVEPGGALLVVNWSRVQRITAPLGS